MKIIKSINRLNKDVNFKANIGFVPTMGSLHKGHLSLIESAKNYCDKIVVSIFINPLQFNKKSDYKKYPKNLTKDLTILKNMKIDYVFLPKISEIYKNKKEIKLKIASKDKILCAKYRKGHFEGVLAVINQFLKYIKAKYMFLGEKDYQQIYLIKKLIKTKFNTKIIICKTIRLKNSLTYSSRNNLLQKKDVTTASKISKKLKNFYSSIKINFKNIKNLNKIKKQIVKYGIKLEYLEIRNKYNFSKKINKSNFKLFIAYYISEVRLIDNF